MTPDQLHAANIRSHLKICEARVACLKSALQATSKDGEEVDQELELQQAHLDSLKGSLEQQRDDLEHNFQSSMKEYDRQIKLSEAMLKKKQEERQMLLEYLKKSDISALAHHNIGNIDWATLMQLVESSYKNNHIEEQHTKAQDLAKFNDKANQMRCDMLRFMSSVSNARDRVRTKTKEICDYIEQWKAINENQLTQIAKFSQDNERINLLLKQCTLTQEPMSDFLSKNVRAKCQSFLNCKSIEELLIGLAKFKTRQERIIKLMRHKDNILARDNNYLQIAKDQTADQMQYYLNIIEARKDLNMNYDPRQQQQQQQRSGSSSSAKLD